jgi:hypothetical protein
MKLMKCLLFAWTFCMVYTISLAQCASGQWPVVINIIPDTYPGETSWSLIANNIQVAIGTTNSDTVCLDSSSCVRFEIYDSYGDGICCGYGNGSYSIFWNGVQMTTGGAFQTIATHSFNCPQGSICENPLPTTLGSMLASQANTFYSFIPDSTGIYSISTCNLSTCDTKIWVYGDCASVDFAGSGAGSLYFNDDNNNCGLQADLDATLTAGETYIIRVGLNGNNPCSSGIPFVISYDGPLSSVLPIIKLTSLGNPINNDVKVPVHMEIIDNGLGQLNYVNQTNFAYEGDIMTELQGFTGPMYPKKNYDFYFIDENGSKIDTTLLGLPSENDWIFKAEYLDNSLLINTVTYEFARRMGRYAPRTKLCEIFLDGTYIGVYTLTEKVKRDKNRLDIAKLSSIDLTGSDLTGGYIIEMNINGDPGSWNSIYAPINSATTSNPVEFKYVYPKADSITTVQANYIKTYVDSFENALNATSFMNGTLGYRNWIDVSTFIDFLIVNEFSMNYDSYGRSTYMYKEKDTDGGKLCIGPPWDYDRAMDSDPTSGWVWENTHPYWPFPFWWSKLYTDSIYRHELACRWLTLRQDEFKTANFFGFVDSLSGLLLQGPATRNFAVWQTLGNSTYSNQITNMKNFLEDRLAWMDSTLAPFGAALPTILIPEDTLVCLKTIYEAPYDPAYSYNWKPGPETPAIVLDSAGLYTLELNDMYGCFASFPMQVALSIPDSTFLQTHLSGDVNYTFSSLNGPTSQYAWSFGDQTLTGEGEQVNHVYASPGNYTVNLIVTDSLGCIAKSSALIYVTEGEIQVNIIPNPSVNNPVITHNIPQDEAFTFMLFDATGRKLMELSQPASPFSLETIGLAHGTYWLQCVFKGKKIAKGIIKL